MNADTRVPDLAACADFAGLWCGFTAAPHLTLTAITPDGPTTTATFARGEAVRLRAFVAREQGMSRNIYFQPNETPPGCASKAGKDVMVAAACRRTRSAASPRGGTSS